MTIEERIELHDQWLRAMESNLERLAADVAQVGRNQTHFSENLLRLLENQTQFATAMVALAEAQRQLAEAHLKLEETLERYIRFRGNGREN